MLEKNSEAEIAELKKTSEDSLLEINKMMKKYEEALEKMKKYEEAFEKMKMSEEALKKENAEMKTKLNEYEDERLIMKDKLEKCEAERDRLELENKQLRDVLIGSRGNCC